MKRMLINATQKEELRIALVDGQKLYDLNIENTKYKKKKLNIYKGKIARIEPSLEAVFIDYGSKKNGFLPIKEISEKYLNKKKTNNIKNILHEGQELIVQIYKDERDNKGAALTTFISLVGNNLILLPNNPQSNGISRRIEGKERKKIKSKLKKINLPKNMSLIIRTSGINKSLEELQLDISLKLKHWEYIKKYSKKKSAPSLIYQENNIFTRIFRDYLYNDINEIIIDNYKIYELAINQMHELNKKDFIKKIKFYKKNIPLFIYFQIESQIESAFKRKLRLPSGGSITIDITEALTSIDINSSKSTKNKNIENTALNTNLEATEEIARQLKLRDLGGLIVIDFIDMSITKNQKIIKNKLKKIIKEDRAKIQLGDISKFGLLEMSRQRLNPSLKESSYYICPRCCGSGNIRDNKSLSLSILRIIEEESLKQNTKKIHAIVPITIASYLLNEKRNHLYYIEKRQKKKIKIIIIPNHEIETPNYSIIRIKKSGVKYLLKNKNTNKNKNIKQKYIVNNHLKFKNNDTHINSKNKNNKNMNILINIKKKILENINLIINKLKKFIFQERIIFKNNNIKNSKKNFFWKKKQDNNKKTFNKTSFKK